MHITPWPAKNQAVPSSRYLLLFFLFDGIIILYLFLKNMHPSSILI